MEVRIHGHPDLRRTGCSITNNNQSDYEVAKQRLKRDLTQAEWRRSVDKNIQQLVKSQNALAQTMAELQKSMNLINNAIVSLIGEKDDN